MFLIIHHGTTGDVPRARAKLGRERRGKSKSTPRISPVLYSTLSERLFDSILLELMALACEVCSTRTELDVLGVLDNALALLKLIKCTVQYSIVLGVFRVRIA